MQCAASACGQKYPDKIQETRIQQPELKFPLARVTAHNLVNHMNTITGGLVTKGVQFDLEVECAQHKCDGCRFNPDALMH